MTDFVEWLEGPEGRAWRRTQMDDPVVGGVYAVEASDCCLEVKFEGVLEEIVQDGELDRDGEEVGWPFPVTYWDVWGHPHRLRLDGAFDCYGIEAAYQKWNETRQPSPTEGVPDGVRDEED